jgi:hypothetical protein
MNQNGSCHEAMLVKRATESLSNALWTKITLLLIINGVGVPELTGSAVKAEPVSCGVQFNTCAMPDRE